MRLFQKKAQNVLEYTTLILVVAAGIIVMGPYVIRSVNAHFKSWEDAVNDATNDPMEEADLSDIPPPPSF